jgi:hypothetical protein
VGVAMKTLGAVMFIHNGDEFDYNYRETIACMKAFADQVVVLDAGSTDGTAEVCASLADSKTKVACIPTEDWEAQKGRTKLSHFQNIAKDLLTTDYYFLLQADEVLHEKSFPSVRSAIASGHHAFVVSRINLWFDPRHQLNVPQDRKPCSTEVVRLAKTKYSSIDDGESISAPSASSRWLRDIRIYHMGFVREPSKMKQKCIHIQKSVFGMDYDKRLDESDMFIPDRYFNRERDAVPIRENLPVFIQKWASERYP